MSSYKENLKSINTFIFDVDGVLTDSSVLLEASGEMSRTMNTRDGWAMQHAVKKGYNICIITGGNSKMVKQRLEYLGVQDVFMATGKKLDIFKQFVSDKDLKLEQVLYMGDDIPDYQTIKMAGIGCCPKDACHEILGVSDYVSHIDGGKGCVRDVIEQTLRLQGNWFDADGLEW